MIRVREVSIDEKTFKLASMSWAQAENYHEESKALLASLEAGQEIPKEKWFDRALKTVEQSLILGGGEWTLERIKNEFDMESGVLLIVKLYPKVLEVSALQPVSESSGEVQAATLQVSPSSVAA